MTEPAIYTRWFNTGLPVREGVYQRKYTYEGQTVVRYCYWNGRTFGWAEHSAEDCAEGYNLQHIASPSQDKPWRGLTEYGYKEAVNAQA